MNVLKCSCCSSTILEVFKGLTPPTTDTRYVDRYPWTHIQKAPFKLWKWKCPKMEVAPNRPSSNYFEHWHCCWIPPLDCGRPDLLEDIYQSGESGVVARSRQGCQVISKSRAFTNLTPGMLLEAVVTHCQELSLRGQRNVHKGTGAVHRWSLRYLWDTPLDWRRR